jgi:uncharacterized protein YdaU (DUF1376 family)
LNFYKRFIGDYAADTRHLSVLEHGAYTLLLDLYYGTEKPLPRNILALMAPRSDDELRAFKVVLKQFFTKQNGSVWFHKRCAQEIKRYKDKIEQNRLSGRKGGINRQANAKRTLDVKSDFRLENQNQNQNQKSEPENSTSTPKPIAQNRGAIELSGFAFFWESYPKKVGKPLARRAWLSKVRDDNRYPEVIAGLERWKACEQWQDPQFIPYPATFLNQLRWQDEVPKNGGTKNEQRIRKNIEAAKRVMESGPEMGEPLSGTLPRRLDRTGNKNLLSVAQKRES